jgi:transcriptional antiterminator RfaH
VKPLAKRWYVAETEHRRESVADENLSLQAFETYHPVHTFCRVTRGRRVEVKESIFPGYLFVRFDLAHDRWEVINGTRGIKRRNGTGLLGAGERPLPLADGVVDVLRARDARGFFGDVLEVMRLVVKAGEQARVLSGPFSSCIGECEWSTKERVGLLLSMFGRPHRVTLDASQVEVFA